MDTTVQSGSSASARSSTASPPARSASGRAVSLLALLFLITLWAVMLGVGEIDCALAARRRGSNAWGWTLRRYGHGAPGSLCQPTVTAAPCGSAGFGEFGDRQGGVGEGVCLVVGRAEHAEDLFGEVVEGGVVDQVGVGECQLQGGEQGSGDGGAGQAGLGGLEAAGSDAGLDVAQRAGGQPRGDSM